MQIVVSGVVEAAVEVIGVVVVSTFQNTIKTTLYIVIIRDREKGSSQLYSS